MMVSVYFRLYQAVAYYNLGRDTPTPLVHRRMEGWVRIRVAGQTDWKRLWMVISAAGGHHLQDGSSMSSAEGGPRPVSPNAPRRKRISQIFMRDHSPPQSNLPAKPLIHFFQSPKPRDRKKAVLTMREVTQAFAVYPERPELISRSTLMKLEGYLGDEEIAANMRLREGWLLIMPELEGTNTRASEMLKFLIGAYSFCSTGVRVCTDDLHCFSHPRCVRSVWETQNVYVGSSRPSLHDVRISHRRLQTCISFHAYSSESWC